VEIDSTPLSPADLRRRIWPVAAIGCTLLAGFSTAYDGWEIVAAGDPVPWGRLTAGQAVDWYLCLAFVPVLAWLAAQMPVRGSRWPVALIVHLSAALLLALVKMALFIGIGEVSGVAGLPFSEAVAVNLDDELIALAALTCLTHLVGVRMLNAPRPSAARPVHFTVRDPHGCRLVRPEEIAWADAQGNYARLHTASGRLLIRSTMTKLERALDPSRFVRIHRGMIVNADHVARIDRQGQGIFMLRLLDGSELRSARSYHGQVSRLLR
jgi:hypothetical protein